MRKEGVFTQPNQSIQNELNLNQQNEIFNSPKMSVQMNEEKISTLTQGQEQLAKLFGGSGGKGKSKRFWGNSEWEGPHQAAFTNTFMFSLTSF